MDQDISLIGLEQKLFSDALSNRIPVFGSFELSPYCNLACKMCYVKETAPGLPVLRGEDWLSIAQRAAQAGTMFAALSGGEPLLHPDFREIYSGLKKLGMVVTINTNATMIDEDMADFLAKDMPRRVNVTLYGASAETYEQLCGSGAAFDKVIRAIELMQARRIPVKINITPTTINYHDLDNIYALCRKYGLHVETALYVFEPIRKMEPGKQMYRLTPEQTAIVHEKWDRYIYTEKAMLLRAQYAKAALAHFDESRSREGTEQISCSAGTGAYTICWDGKMVPCTGMTAPRADVREVGFAAAWEETKAYRDTLRVPAVCSGCSLKPFCMVCAAMNLHANNAFDQPVQFMCDATKEYAQRLAKMIPDKAEKENDHEV